MTIELYLNNKLADIDDSVRVIVDRYVTTYRNPAAGTGTFTYSFKLPNTAANRLIFNHADNLQVVGKFIDYDALIMVNGVRIMKGVFKLDSIKKGFSGHIIGTVVNYINNLIDTDKSLRDIKSFTPIKFYGNSTIGDYFLNPTYGEIAYTYVIASFSAIPNAAEIGYEDIGISHFCKSILERMFADVGYKVAGNVLNKSEVTKMLLQYSNADSVAQAWNYGLLNPFKAKADNSYAPNTNKNISTTIERYDDKVHVIYPQFLSYQGDLSDSSGDDGVYTCKSSGTYSIRVSCPMAAYYLQTGQPPLEYRDDTFRYIYVFRCITNNEFLKDTQLPRRDYFNIPSAALSITDEDTYIIGEGEYDVRMTEGQQYAVQVYASMPKELPLAAFSIFSKQGVPNYLECTAMKDGKLTVNPADFLPDKSYKDFLTMMFKVHNLYYNIDTLTKTVNFFSRDEFFNNSIDGVIDITDKIDFDEIEETPIPNTEVNDNYYKWASDDSDYILTNTNYMELVNGVDNNATELTFAPLCFVTASYIYRVNNIIKTTQDFFPAIIPYSESNDARILTDIELENNNNYAPRICYFHGNIFTDAFSKTLPNELLVPLKGYGGRLYAPRLSFFDLPNQVSYDIVVNDARRDFELVQNAQSNIFELNEAFIKPAISVKSLDLISDNSSFLINYKDVIKINKYSNYLSTVIRINPVLFDKLTGRYLLRINNINYILDSVTEYDMIGETATIRVYRNI
jgi:hypothetical protein